MSQQTLTWTEGVSGVDPDWDAMVARTEGGHHAQISLWGMVQSRRGWDVARLLLLDGAEPIGGAQFLTRKLRGIGRVAYLDRGPFLPEGRPELLIEAVDQIQTFARGRGVGLLLAQPPDHAHDLHRVMRTTGFGGTHFKTSLAATTVLDLGHGPDELLARMKSKTRYNIRVGQRSELTVRRGEQPDVAVFHAMLEKTASRQGFVANSRSYLEDVFETLGPWCQIFLAEYRGSPVAGMLAMTFGDTVVYKRGAWSGEEGNRRPNEFMHWEVIQWAIEQGFAKYDFDGIEPDVAEAVLAGQKISGSAAESVTRFKLGFAGEVVLLPETSTYLPNRLLRFGHDRIYPKLANLGPMKHLVKKLRVG